MSNMSTFQLGILLAFMAFLAIAVLLFAGVIPGFRTPTGGYGGEVTLWATIPDPVIRPIIDQINQAHSKEFTLRYVAQNAETYEQTLIDALASGNGPDIFTLPQDLIVKHENKIFVIPFDSISERSFKDMFAEGGELYLTKDGIIALPLLIDPIVMYWNRDIFSGAGLSNPPAYWDEFLTLSPALTKIDQSKNVLRATIAAGAFDNITNAKDILALLFIQAGSTIIMRGEQGFFSTLLERNAANQSPAESALRFYTEFSNPSQNIYSWNRALPASHDMFTRGDLAVYFGYASERDGIAKKNPHLNFDVAPVPQIRDEKVRKAFGNMTGLAIAKNSQNIQTAFSAAYLMTGSDIAGDIAQVLNLPPARRDLLSQKPTDAFGAVFYDSALIARAWLDPNPKETYTIWKEMIEGVSSGRLKVGEAVFSASQQLGALHPNQ